MCDISFPFDRDQYFILMIKRIHIAGKKDMPRHFLLNQGYTPVYVLYDILRTEIFDKMKKFQMDLLICVQVVLIHS